MVFKTLRIYIRLLQLQLNSQQQIMEGATVALFWGSVLAQYIWFQKEYLYNETKRIVQSAAQSVWNKSTDKMKNTSQSKTSTSEQVQDKQLVIPESLSNITKQLQEDKNLVNKQKKIKKIKAKQSKNLRNTIKKYEDWFLQNRNIRKMAKKIQNSTPDRQDVSLQFKRESCDFNDNMKNYNVEQLYEEYCDEHEVQFSNCDILGYNPVVSDVEEETGSRHGSSFTKNR